MSGGYYGKGSNNVTTNVDGIKKSNVFIDEAAAASRGPAISITFDENGEIEKVKGSGIDYEKDKGSTEE